MMEQNTKAYLAGVLIIAAVSVLALLSMEALKNAYIAWLIWGAPAIGAFATASMAKNKKMLLAVTLAVPAAVIFGLENYLWQILGMGSDFPGFKGFLIVVGYSFIGSLVMCCAGGAVGAHNYRIEKTR